MSGVLQRVWEGAHTHPDAAALSTTSGHRTYSYHQLVREVCAQARSLSTGTSDALQPLTGRAGVRAGDTVLVLSDSTAEAYIAILACMWLGAVPAVAAADSPSAVVEDYCATVTPVAILTPTAGAAPNVDSPPARLAAGAGDTYPPVAFEGEQPLVILFTSGTTGSPKAVMLPQRSLLAIPDAIAAHGLEWITWRAGEVTYTPLPPSHIGGLWWVLNGLARGCHAVTGPTPDMVAALHAWGVATTCMVPTLLGRLADAVRGGSPLPPSFRLAVYGGSRAIRRDVSAIEATGVRTAQIYGLSETGCTALCLPTSADVAESGRSSLQLIDDACVGVPYPGVQVQVLADPRATPSEGAQPSPGDEGTLWVRTPARMLGYFRNPEQTSATLHGEWINTGDRVQVSHVDPQGRPLIHLRGRVSELIICGGANVNPDEVDAIAMAHPSLRDAAAFSIPDATFGELVGLAVVPDGGLDGGLAGGPDGGSPLETQQLQRAVAAHFRQHAAGEARPARIVVVDRIPRTASGKIRRHELTQRFSPQNGPRTEHENV